MFGSTHLSEKDSDRQEIEYPQLQEQQSHPREDALPSDDWVKRDYYLGGTGSWAGQQSSSPNNLRVKQSSGENQYPPLIDFTEPTTFTQGGSNQGSGSNRNPTYSFQDFVSGRSGIQQPNGGKHRRKSLSVDNDDGEDNGPARFERVEAAWGHELQNGEKYIKCAAGLGWNIPCLKEHLLRVHEGPLRCCVCGLVFSNSQKDTLTVLESTCRDLQLLSPLRGMTPDMKIRIRNRYKHGRLTAEQKWFDIYRVLFPDAELPSSPYRDEFYNLPSVSPGSDMIPRLKQTNLGFQTASTVLGNVNHYRHMPSEYSSTKFEIRNWDRFQPRSNESIISPPTP